MEYYSEFKKNEIMPFAAAWIDLEVVILSECGGILELRRGSQPSPWVGPGKHNLPLGLRGKAGGCARVTAGPKRPHLGVCP